MAFPSFSVLSATSHTAAIAAGNNGIPVRMHGYEFGKASGMAPRARRVTMTFTGDRIFKLVNHYPSFNNRH